MRKPLALAAQHRHPSIVRLLLQHGVDPNRYSPPGSHSHATPLHQAALAGHLEIARILVEHEARTDLKDNRHGATPLGWAEYAGHSDLAQFLDTVRSAP